MERVVNVSQKRVNVPNLITLSEIGDMVPVAAEAERVESQSPLAHFFSTHDCRWFLETPY